MKRNYSDVTIYRERAGGRFEFWTYADGRRYFLPESEARAMLRVGAQLIKV